jgi:hypothetical protein
VRLWLPAAVLFAAVGCSSKWTLVTDTDVPSSKLLYFHDEDGDGWGTGDPTELVAGGDPASKLTARNGRDCDDTTAEATRVTGKVGSVCPNQFGTGGAEVQYLGIVSTNEFLATYGTTAAVFPGYAASVCSLAGWGGGVATFDSSQLSAAETSIAAAVGASGTWAGWIGIVASSDGNTWQWETHPGNPDAWDDDSSLASIGGELKFCTADDGVGSDTHIPDTSTWRFAPAPARLALVLKSGTWCIGSPTYLDESARLRAQYICERPPPNKTVYDIYTVSSDTDQ